MRLDHAAAIDFLTSTAGVLFSHELIQEKDTQNLRLSLRGISLSPELSQMPLIAAMAHERSEFLMILEARYGQLGYCINLLRYSIKPKLLETLELLKEFGLSVIRKAELLFNRPFVLTTQGMHEQTVPYSAVLIDFAEAIHRISERIFSECEALAAMHGHAMAGYHEKDSSADEAIAQALGFKEVIHSTRLGRAELSGKAVIAASLEALADETSFLLDQLAKHAGSQAAYAAAVGCDTLRAEAFRLSHLDLPFGGGIIAWEIRRHGILEALESVNQAIRMVSQNTLVIIGHERNVETLRLSESVKRRLSFDLIAHGTQPLQAVEASNAFFDHLDQEKISPSQILLGELSRIHPSLTGASLDAMISLERDQSLMMQAKEKKSSARMRAQSLAARFGSLSFCLALLLMGCGLKTRPVSEIPAARADIPFRMQDVKPSGKGEDLKHEQH